MVVMMAGVAEVAVGQPSLAFQMNVESKLRPQTFVEGLTEHIH